MCGNANGGTVEMLGNTTTPYHFLKLHYFVCPNKFNPPIVFEKSTAVDFPHQARSIGTSFIPTFAFAIWDLDFGDHVPSK